MASLKYSEESGDKVQGEIKTAKHLVIRTMLVDTTVNPGF